MPREYLLFFAQTLEEFRIPEVQAVCDLLDIKISYDHAGLDVTASRYYQMLDKLS